MSTHQQIKALKQEGDNTINLDFIIESSSEQDARQILEGFAIIILQVEDYKQNPLENTNMLLEFGKEGRTYKVCLVGESYEKACENFIKSGFDVTRCNNISGDLSQEASDEILQGVKSSFEQQQQQQKQQAVEEKTARDNQFKDSQQEKVLGIVEETIEEIEQFVQKAQGISGGNLKKLTSYADDLKKLRMGSNTDKITQTLEQIFLFMEKLEIDYAATMKSQEEPIMQNSLVSDVDVSTEVSKYTKAQRVHASKANATAEDSYYITTGAVGLYIRFLKKDFGSKMKKTSEILQNVMYTLQHIVVFLAINLTIFIVLQQLQGNIIPENLYGYLIQTGTIGLAMTIAKVLKFDNIIMLIAQVGLTVFLYFVIINFITINFAL